MKSIIQLMAITALATFVLTGCNQDKPGDPGSVPSTNTFASDVNSMAGGTNTAFTNATPVINTNLPPGK